MRLAERGFAALGVALVAASSPAVHGLPPPMTVNSAAMVTPPGSTATIRVILTVTTALGTSSDDDIRTMATTGAVSAAFVPTAQPFTSTQLNQLDLQFANTTFTFQLYCLPFIGCQTLNVTVNNLHFELVQPNCTAIGTGGQASFSGALFHTTGSYVASGIASGSGPIDGTSAATFGARVTNPSAGLVKFDQLTIADQTFIVPPESLPAGVTYLAFTVQTNLTNTTFSGPYALTNEFDADFDGALDWCDACTDIDGDGFGDPGYPNSGCAVDNCPGVFNPDQADANGNGIGDACETVSCPADVTADGFVDFDDVLAIIMTWGACADPGNCPADVNGDGEVNFDDVLEVIMAWGVCA